MATEKTASYVYRVRNEEIDRKLALIERLRDHRDSRPGRRIDWSHAGTLGRVNELLDEIVATLR